MPCMPADTSVLPDTVTIAITCLLSSSRRAFAAARQSSLAVRRVGEEQQQQQQHHHHHHHHQYQSRFIDISLDSSRDQLLSCSIYQNITLRIS